LPSLNPNRVWNPVRVFAPSSLFFFQMAENRLHSYGMQEERGGVFFYREMHPYEMHATRKIRVIKKVNVAN
jgi:hypothetical protein